MNKKIETVFYDLNNEHLPPPPFFFDLKYTVKKKQYSHYGLYPIHVVVLQYVMGGNSFSDDENVKKKKKY